MIRRGLLDTAAAVMLLSLPLFCVRGNRLVDEDPNPIDRFLLHISAPIQAGVVVAAEFLRETWNNYLHLVDLQRKNVELATRNKDLRQRLDEIQTRLRKLSNYEELLRFKNSYNLGIIAARVIGRSSSPFSRTTRIRIDRGSASVRPGDFVITTTGIVGRIGRVYGQYSDVILAAHPKSTIDVVIERTGARGFLRGRQGSTKYSCRLSHVPAMAKIAVGDLVVSSGAGGIFPPKIAVGQVSKIFRPSYGLHQDIDVVPSVDYGSLREVLVGRPSPAPDPIAVPETEKEASEKE